MLPTQNPLQSDHGELVCPLRRETKSCKEDPSATGVHKQVVHVVKI